MSQFSSRKGSDQVESRFDNKVELQILLVIARGRGNGPWAGHLSFQDFSYPTLTSAKAITKACDNRQSL